MTDRPPRITLARHGQTAWSLEGRHTGRNDIPLTPEGEAEARKLGAALRRGTYGRVLSSPLRRARVTCDLAGFGDRVELMDDLMKWNYGAYEGLRSAEIRATRPDWHLFRDGCPDGERLEDVVARADRVVASLKSRPMDTLVFAHGHFLRVLAVRWARIPPELGDRFALASAAISILSVDAASGEPILDRWNDISHLT